MKLKNQICKNPKWLVLPVTAALMAAGATFNVYGATAAGTIIKNLATVTYEDSQGNTFTAQSNEAIVTVAQIYSASINTNTTDVFASPGQPVDIPYTLENTGNGIDTYQLSAADVVSSATDTSGENTTIYEDLNSNGQADAGEPVISSITLNAGEIKNLVIRTEVPVNAVESDTLGITLTAEAEEGTGAAVPTSVTDLSSNEDLADSTVETIVTVTGDAVILATKDSVHNPALNQITYTLNIRNNGNNDALAVLIQDGIPANTTLVPGSISTSGILASNTDTVPQVVTLNETADGLDYNSDGDAADVSVDAIQATDAILPANATVSITYTVTYDPTVFGVGGSTISNTAFITGDVDGDGTPDETIPTNQVNDVIGDVLVVSIEDTGNTGGAIGSPGVNDGVDDDVTLNDIQVVDTVAAGEQVIFKNVITNGGNSDDILEISVDPGSFPAGTAFTLWNEEETLQLSDTNSAFGVDTGVLASGESRTITVIAQLPATTSGAGPYDATVTVTSGVDTTVFDTVTNRLSEISDATVDIHSIADGVLNSNEDPLNLADPAVEHDVILNESLEIPLYIDNDRDGPSTFELTVGSVLNTADDSVGDLPNGWTVDFYAVDQTTGARIGSPITTTPLIDGQTTDYQILAVVSVPFDQTLATDDFSSDVDGDDVDDFLDGNGDGDGDYPFFFHISSTTGATDVVFHTIDVAETISASLTPNGSGQVDPGGSEVYVNTLTNTGNAVATYEVESANSQVGWTSTIAVDTDGDGVADTELTNLPATITVRQPDGTTATIEVDTSGANPQFTLEPGESVLFTSTIFSPANAPDGEVDVYTLTAEDIVTNDVLTVQNLTQVVSGKVRIEKVVAIDTDCNGISDDATATAFQVAQLGTVEPDQCVVWKITADNQGTDTALNVIVRDAAPSFTTFEPGTLNYCLNFNCALAPAAGSNAEEIGGEIVFYVGTGATLGTGGTLVAGDQATMTFSVRVD